MTAAALSSQAITVVIDRPFSAVYEFLCNPENFRQWASGLGTLSRDGERWLAQTPEGTAVVRFTERNPYGVVDHTVTLPNGAEVYIPLRLIANGGGSELALTLFRQPEMDDAKFADDADWVRRDMATLKQLLER